MMCRSLSAKVETPEKVDAAPEVEVKPEIIPEEGEKDTPKKRTFIDGFMDK